MHRARVDLPQPDSPTRPSVSPVRTSRLTSSTACTRATSRCRTPFLIGKYFLMCSARTSTSPSQLGLATVISSGSLTVVPSPSPCLLGQLRPGGQLGVDGDLAPVLLLLRVEVAGVQVAEAAEPVLEPGHLGAPVEPVRTAGT